MDSVSLVARHSHDNSVKSVNVDIASVSSHSDGRKGMRVSPNSIRNRLTEGSDQGLETSSSSVSHSCCDYPVVLGVDCHTPGFLDQKPAGWRCSVCSENQRVTSIPTIPVSVYAYCHRSLVQHILGLDRLGHKAHGTILSAEQEGWSIGQGFVAFGISLRFHPSSTHQSCEGPVSVPSSSSIYPRVQTVD